MLPSWSQWLRGCRGEARQRPRRARIFFSSSRVRSSGFAWNAPGAGRFMLSAGHCYTSSSGTFGAVNRKNANGQLNAIGSVTYSSVASYGTVAGRHGDFAVYKLSGDKDNLGKILLAAGFPADASVWPDCVRLGAATVGKPWVCRSTQEPKEARGDTATRCPRPCYQINPRALPNGSAQHPSRGEAAHQVFDRVTEQATLGHGPRSSLSRRDLPARLPQVARGSAGGSRPPGLPRPARRGRRPDWRHCGTRRR